MKRPSLASSMKALKEDVAPDPVALVAKAREQSPSKYHAATREGMKRLLTPVSPALHRRLKIRAAEQDTTLEALTRAALEAYLNT
jgi:predicted HicB family RNase H-like nuclease